MLIDPKMMRFAAAMSSAVMTKGVLIFCGYYFGDKLDHRFGSSPLCMLLGITAGAGIGLWYVMKVLERNRQ